MSRNQQMTIDAEVLKTMHCFYPSYIDATLTRPQGRRIPKENAVENPHMVECIEVFKSLGVPFVPENKTYSRDILRVGRIKYSMCPLGSDQKIAANKRVLLNMIAAAIPKLKSRTNPPAPAPATGGKKQGGGKKKKK
eukprot:TRINITY_DN9687_c0_g1_i1.p1 TRINITY_DN9687_c0_g1~~TRINITY_DN9687_c0_g1_i1.p1  ORF type:complete len:137 (-),score=31.57 TRINITY_DN9687_c0_g1_i1:373-783(-)